MDNKENRNERYARFKKKQWHWAYMLLAIIFVIVIYGLSVLSIIAPDKTTSEQENRNLQQYPEITLTGIKDQTWMDELESYVSDQFIGRDAWVSFKTVFDRIQGRKEFNGNYLGKDGYLMQIPSSLTADTKATVEENMNGINEFAERHNDLHINMMIAPNAAYTLTDKLPKGAPVRDQLADREWLEELLTPEVGSIDIFTTLRDHQDDEIYYKTDHHWTTLGAEYAFLAAAESLGIEEPITSYDEYTVTTEFQGTLSSNSGYHGQEDAIEVFAPKGVEESYIVTDSDNQEKRTTIYDTDALDTKNKYEVFFGGNHALVDITTTSDSDKSILIFKDSYANCFVPFLIPYYSEIIMVDPRYYYDNVDSLIESHNITDVLFLYNMDTFLGDNSLADVLAGDTEDEATEETSDDTETENTEDADTTEDTVDTGDTGTDTSADEESEEDQSTDKTTDQTNE